ncbi:RHS repeat domain-containing protein [Lysinibacillus irui]|uniref:RHS repeat domain-containing protein n=1 Tax=Lysinibacillus irui TaxID=2998077 RepID=UPI00237F6E78|nr:RHS repeat-associated core domain-containing protein [Lysinibacillus irui]
MQYNELGQEIERILPGDVISKWQYDITGRPTHHRVSSQSRDMRRRVYNWDVNHQLRSMVNELTGVKVTYGYDEFSNLVWANQDSKFDFLYRSVDDVGNLYETKDKKDRVYGAGSRLLETQDAQFSYDEEGNLIEKVEKNGDTWKYEYYGNGMMSKVIKPDNTEVTFKYDSLGRRIEKSSEDKATQFVWDGNTILHEYSTENVADTLENLNSSQTDTAIADNLVTWVFNDSFVPSAKITSEGHYSIISDYLGTPVEAYDEEGNRVWSAQLDIYGRVKEFTGEKDFIPFRYQGQYKDVETGLYYNRFRYYDPEQGNYTQIDPIGLVGGNPSLYGYVKDPNTWFDVFGMAPWKNGGFDKWFNNATPEEVSANIGAVKKQLRNGGGKHELFPVSDAAKARELGFKAEELKKMAIDKDKFIFVDVPDKDGNLHTGPHSTGKKRIGNQSSKASSNFHIHLSNALQGANTKREARLIIGQYHRKYMKVSCK